MSLSEQKPITPNRSYTPSVPSFKPIPENEGPVETYHITQRIQESSKTAKLS